MSDFSVGSKILINLYRFYTEQCGKMPVYFGNDISEFYPAGVDYPDIPHKKQSTAKLDCLADSLFKDTNINLSCLAMTQGGELVNEYYKPPYSKYYRRVSYSVCKTVVALGIGIAIDKGLLSLDTRLYDLFPEHSGVFIKKGIKQITIKHLLTMTAGVSFDEANAFFSFDWRKDFMGGNMLFSPGKEFYYNSLNSYMLGACINKASGKELMDFLRDNLFEPMDIYDITWDKCPMGLPKGGWGMKLSLRDMLALGELVKNRGVIRTRNKRKRIISREYMSDMLSVQVKINNRKHVCGYGYGIWILDDRSYLMNGIFGQNVYINTERDLVIATFGSANELFPDGRLVEKIMCFAKESDKIERMSLLKSIERLAFIKRESLQKIKLFHNSKKELNRIKGLMGQYLGINYRFSDYASGILPIITQVMYSNYLKGIDCISFYITGDGFYIKIRDNDIEIKLKMGYSQLNPYEYQIINVGGKEIPVAAAAGITFDEDNQFILKIHLVFLEEVGDKILKISFNDDRIRMRVYEPPGLIGFMDKFAGDMELFSKRGLNKFISPDYIKYKISNFLQPDVEGVIDE